MAGKIRHLLNCNGRYYARLAVPASLRPIIRKRELTEALDADKRTAERMLPSVIAGMQRKLDAARMQTGSTRKGRTEPVKGKLMTPKEMAIEHYADQVRFDEEARNADHRYSIGYVDQDYVSALKRAVAGSAPNDELTATVGRIIRHSQAQGNTRAQTGSAEWRELTRAIAVAELEALQRTAERDDGDLAASRRTQS